VQELEGPAAPIHGTDSLARKAAVAGGIAIPACLAVTLGVSPLFFGAQGWVFLGKLALLQLFGLGLLALVGLVLLRRAVLDPLRKSAQGIKCAANMRQFTLALNFYAAENKALLPYTNSESGETLSNPNRWVGSGWLYKGPLDDAGAPDAAVDLDPVRLERPGDEGGGALLLEAELGVGVEIAPRRGHLLVELGDALDDGHGDASPVRGRAHDSGPAPRFPRGRTLATLGRSAPRRRLHAHPTELTRCSYTG